MFRKHAQACTSAISSINYWFSEMNGIWKISIYLAHTWGALLTMKAFWMIQNNYVGAGTKEWNEIWRKNPFSFMTMDEILTICPSDAVSSPCQQSSTFLARAHAGIHCLDFWLDARWSFGNQLRQRFWIREKLVERALIKCVWSGNICYNEFFRMLLLFCALARVLVRYWENGIWQPWLSGTLVHKRSSLFIPRCHLALFPKSCSRDCEEAMPLTFAGWRGQWEFVSVLWGLRSAIRNATNWSIYDIRVSQRKQVGYTLNEREWVYHSLSWIVICSLYQRILRSKIRKLWPEKKFRRTKVRGRRGRSR